MKQTRIILCFAVVLSVLTSCSGSRSGAVRPVELVVLDPGHFHASLLLKNPLADVAETVRVYAPEGPEVEQYLAAVKSYNHRADDPTSWQEEVYIGEDYLEKMLSDGRGEVVVLAGNNSKKTSYILSAVKSGYNVLSDKPLAINKKDFDMLSEAYREAAAKGLLIYDLMTERYDMLNIITRELLHDTALFGDLLPGTSDAPSIVMQSVHNFFKTVSGNPLIRPAWYYDVEQQGEGIADVTTHLIDLVAWQCFPDEVVRYDSDVEVLAAKHWPTRITLPEYSQSTGVEVFPSYLDKYIKDGVLEVMSNGSLVYKVKGIHVGMGVIWNYASPNGGDLFTAEMRGSKATLEIVQNENTGFVKQLYIRRSPSTDTVDFEKKLQIRSDELREAYPFISIEKTAPDLYLIDIPQKDRLGHEAHFNRVAQTFLHYLRSEDMPEWENENTLSKYYITTTAVELAKETIK